MSIAKVGDVGGVCSEDASAVHMKAGRLGEFRQPCTTRAGSGPTERLRGHHRASETFGAFITKFRNIFHSCSTHSSISMQST